MELMNQLRRDFREFKDSCMGILLYGSHAKGKSTKRSDVDVCLVKPKAGVYERILQSLGGKYDVKIFEELPLYIQWKSSETTKSYTATNLNCQSTSTVSESCGGTWSTG